MKRKKQDVIKFVLGEVDNVNCRSTNDRLWHVSDELFKGRLSTHNGQSGYIETEPLACRRLTINFS